MSGEAAASTRREQSLARLHAEVAELRRLVVVLMAQRTPQGGLDLIPLEHFAHAVGRSAKTIRNDINSPDPLRRRRWPRFVRSFTDSVEVRRWLEDSASSYGDPAVEAALRRAVER